MPGESYRENWGGGTNLPGKSGAQDPTRQRKRRAPHGSPIFAAGPRTESGTARLQCGRSLSISPAPRHIGCQTTANDVFGGVRHLRSSENVSRATSGRTCRSLWILFHNEHRPVDRERTNLGVAPSSKNLFCRPFRADDTPYSSAYRTEGLRRHEAPMRCRRPQPLSVSARPARPQQVLHSCAFGRPRAGAYAQPVPLCAPL